MSDFCYPCTPHLRNAAGPYIGSIFPVPIRLGRVVRRRSTRTHGMAEIADLPVIRCTREGQRMLSQNRINLEGGELTFAQSPPVR